MRRNRKATCHYKGKLQKVFPAGLNEIKYDYVASKQHLYLQYHVAATDMKPLCKKTNDTSSSGVSQVYRAWGQTQIALPARSWQHKIKETLQSDALLQLSNSNDKVFLPLLLKMHRLYCQKAD